MTQTFISIDVETDGPIPGPHSMLSLGAAAFNEEGLFMGSFSANLVELPGALPDPETAKWWATQPEAWAACRADPEPALPAMHRFYDWCQTFHNPVAVAYPAGFDFMFVYWYLIKFVGKSPFSFSCLDIKTYAWALLGGDYKNATKRNFPMKWMPKAQHTHVAADDAYEQGLMFLNMLKGDAP